METSKIIKKNNKLNIPHKIINKEKCYKFKSNPQRFFTEDLCDTVLKAYDLEPINKKTTRINSISPSQKKIYNKKLIQKNKIIRSESVSKNKDKKKK